MTVLFHAVFSLLIFSHKIYSGDGEEDAIALGLGRAHFWLPPILPYLENATVHAHI